MTKQLAEIDQQLSAQQEVTRIVERRLEKLSPDVRDGTFSQVEFEKYQADALSGRTRLNVLSRQRLDAEHELRTLQDQLQHLSLTNEAQQKELPFRLSGISQFLAQSKAQNAFVRWAAPDGVS